MGLVHHKCVLVIVDAAQPPAVLGEARSIELLEERADAGRDDGVEHHVHLVGDDAAHRGGKIDLVERIVLLEDHLAAIALDYLARIGIDRLRPDIVGARHREPSATILDQPGNELVAILSRYRPGAEQIGRALLALVALRIDVERLATRDDDVLDGIAHRA